MKPRLYTFVSEETLHSMAVTFYACVKLPIQIINEHGKTLVSEGESPHFCHLFQKHLPSYDSCVSPDTLLAFFLILALLFK